MKRQLRRPQIRFVARTRAAPVDGFDSENAGRVRRRQTNIANVHKNYWHAFFHRAATDWSGHATRPQIRFVARVRAAHFILTFDDWATALYESANILLLSFARFRFDDGYTGLANISGRNV